ncbi:hypothetical protein Sjap_005223 [Stephania japonica]|uniref:Uncharacterized protein n=1 Tax=Stephania japonica TaxID=461633 RepID=A0AAP0K623_9MAGN
MILHKRRNNYQHMEQRILLRLVIIFLVHSDSQTRKVLLQGTVKDGLYQFDNSTVAKAGTSSTSNHFTFIAST